MYSKHPSGVPSLTTLPRNHHSDVLQTLFHGTLTPAGVEPKRFKNRLNFHTRDGLEGSSQSRYQCRGTVEKQTSKGDAFNLNAHGVSEQGHRRGTGSGRWCATGRGTWGVGALGCGHRRCSRS